MNNFPTTSVAAGPPKPGLSPGTKKRSPKPPKIRAPEKAPSPLPKGAVAPCSECGRKFFSWKALFGHMRCHPERRWRGIIPPPLRSQSLADEYEVAACLLLLANGTLEVETASGSGGVFVGIDLNRPVAMEGCSYLDLRLSL